jgi:choice-of-anchor B domain-containing protein
MNRSSIWRNSAFRISLALALCAAGLTACGGGGGGGSPAPTPTPTPTPPPVQAADFGGSVLGKVARTGVAGTWGYVAPDGSRYAVMGTAKGVLVLDLRDSANPRVVDEVDGPTNTPRAGIYWREMRVYGNYAYIVSEQTNVRGGVMIIDLSSLPTSVRFVKSIVPRDGELSAHTIDIDTARGLMYLQRDLNMAAPVPLAHFEKPSGWGSADEPGKGEHHHGAGNQGSIEIWDIKTDPENPRYITTFNQFKSVHDMTAVGDFVYVAEGEASSFSIWNVSNPAAPALVVRWPVKAGNYAHNIWPSGDRSFVVTTEEIPFGLPARVWQLNGSAAPTELASFKTGTGTPHNVVMEGRMAYLSHYTEGAVAVDLSNPAAPRIIARVDTNPSTGADLTGCWGIYKFPGLPLMACSDINNGFHLIGITGT